MPGKLHENLLKIPVKPCTTGFVRLQVLQAIETASTPVTVKNIQETLLETGVHVHHQTVRKVLGEILVTRFKNLKINIIQIKTGLPRRGLVNAFFITYNS